MYRSGKIYFHGLKVGQKLENIKTNSYVGFETVEFKEVIKEKLDCPCDADAVYQSVVVRGKARILDDVTKNEEILRAILKKYAPDSFCVLFNIFYYYTLIYSNFAVNFFVIPSTVNIQTTFCRIKIIVAFILYFAYNLIDMPIDNSVSCFFAEKKRFLR